MNDDKTREFSSLQDSAVILVLKKSNILRYSYWDTCTVQYNMRVLRPLMRCSANRILYTPVAQ